MIVLVSRSILANLEGDGIVFISSTPVAMTELTSPWLVQCDALFANSSATLCIAAPEYPVQGRNIAFRLYLEMVLLLLLL